MERIVFAHISDTHLSCKGSSAFLDMAVESCGEPWENLKGFIGKIKEAKPKFILHTGDIIHEGEKGDYQKLRLFLKEHLGDIPIFFTLGNHDDRHAFMEGYLEEKGQEQFNRIEKMGDLSIISIDTAFGKGMFGEVTNEQLDFLENAMLTLNNGILLTHHPLTASVDDFALPSSARLERILKQGKMILLLSGHTHYRYNSSFCGIPSFTANGLAFGLQYDHEKGVYHNRLGGHLCTIKEDGSIGMEDIFISPKEEVLKVNYYR